MSSYYNYPDSEELNKLNKIILHSKNKDAFDINTQLRMSKIHHVKKMMQKQESFNK